MRIRPTELGLKGMLLLAALELAFLAASYSNLFFLLIAFCCVLGGLGLWWGYCNVRSVHVELGDVPLAAADAPRPLRLCLTSGPKTRFDLAIEVVVRGRVFELSHAALVAGNGTLQAILPGLPRGVHPVERLSIASRFPFGFFRVRRDIATTVLIVTHPDPELAAADRTQRRTHSDRFAVAGKRSSTVAGLRAFRSGDTMADVHWRASARRGTPIVKERELESGLGIEVVLDRRCTDEQLEVALSAITGLLLEQRQHERSLRISSQDYSARAGHGGFDNAAVLRWLAAASTMPASAENPPAGSARCLRLPALIRPGGSDA